MTFGRWYPLAQAGDNAPAQPGVLQLRLEQGLVDYPTGKSAMIHYALCPDLRRSAGELAALHDQSPWLCRHSETLTSAERADLEAAFVRLVDTFRARFGAAPTVPS